MQEDDLRILGPSHILVSAGIFWKVWELLLK